jgi:prephenate dehydratase
VAEALAALERVCDDVRFLGSYPRADGRQNRAAPA